jgi:uncharacterized protein YegL
MSTTLVHKSDGLRYAPVRIPTLGEKVLVVVLVIDRSGSMGEFGKIQSVNYAISSSVRQMKRLMKGKEGIKAILVVIGFGQTASVLVGPETFDKIEWKNLDATQNSTLIAPAIELLNKELHRILDGKRGLKPVAVVVSDGLAQDQRESMTAIQSFLNSKWGARAIRVGVGISGVGGDCDLALLKAFMNNPEQEPLVADDAAKLGDLIQWTIDSSVRGSMGLHPGHQQPLFPSLPPLTDEDEDEDEEDENDN